MRKLLSKYCETTRLTFCFIVMAKFYHQWKDRQIKTWCQVVLIIVINVSMAFLVGRHHLGALLDFHLAKIFRIAFPKIWRGGRGGACPILSKEEGEVPLGTISYQTSFKRSWPFWLLIGARKLLCFSAQSESSRPCSHFVCSYMQRTWSSAVRHVYLTYFGCSQRWKIQHQNKCKENVRNICDYLTGKYTRPFAGIITVAYLKLNKNIIGNIVVMCSCKRTAKIDLLSGSKPRIICWEEKVQKGMFLNSLYWQWNVAAVVCYELWL